MSDDFDDVYEELCWTDPRDAMGGPEHHQDPTQYDDEEDHNPALGCAIAVVFGLMFWTVVGYFGYKLWSWF